MWQSVVAIQRHADATIDLAIDINKRITAEAATTTADSLPQFLNNDRISIVQIDRDGHRLCDASIIIKISMNIYQS